MMFGIPYQLIKQINNEAQLQRLPASFCGEAICLCLVDHDEDVKIIWSSAGTELSHEVGNQVTLVVAWPSWGVRQ